MNDFPAMPQNSTFEAAKAEILEYYHKFCSCNSIIMDIKEATNMAELKGICSFMNSLCLLLSRVDPTGIQRDYSIDLRVFVSKLNGEQ